MVAWHHQLDGHEFEQDLGVGDGWIGKPCMLQSMGSKRVKRDWAAELNGTYYLYPCLFIVSFQQKVIKNKDFISFFVLTLEF